jgi:hypothetical protein
MMLADMRAIQQSAARLAASRPWPNLPKASLMARPPVQPDRHNVPLTAGSPRLIDDPRSSHAVEAGPEPRGGVG